MDFIIEAALEDIENLAELFDQYRTFYGQQSDMRGGKEFIEERIKNEDSKIFIAINGDKITGFVQLYPVFSSTRMKKLWLLNDLYIHPDFRGRGISKSLIDKCKEYCEATKACGIILETEKSNKIGNSLYPKTGFKLDNEHNFYSWDN